MRAKKFKRPSKIVKNKKAQAAESQFNWIFILIVGAVILGFFVFIVIKQKTASEAKFSGKITKQLNTILVGAKVSSGTVQDIPTPEVAIQFECNDYFIGPASQRLGNRIVFAPQQLEGNRLTTWTLDWNVPFKVTSFLYITSPTVRYYVIGDPADQETNEFYQSLPPKLNKRLVSFSDFQSGDLLYENDKNVRFIFYKVASSGMSFNIPPTFTGKVRVSGLNIVPSEGLMQFLQPAGGFLNTAGSAIPYHQQPILYGGIFSDNTEIFNCVMKRAYDRLNVISQVYLEKLNALAPSHTGTSCEAYYLNNGRLQDLTTATEEYPPNYALIGDAVNTLKNDNTRLQLQSCPLIY